VTDDTEKTEILNAFFVLFHTGKACSQTTAGTRWVWERVGKPAVCCLEAEKHKLEE